MPPFSPTWYSRSRAEGIVGQQSHHPGVTPRPTGVTSVPIAEVGLLAEYPCDWHHARYPEESTRVFLNLYRGDSRAAFRASVCPQCLADLVSEWLAQALHRDPRGFWVIPDGADSLDALWERRSEATEGMNGRKRP